MLVANQNKGSSNNKNVSTTAEAFTFDDLKTKYFTKEILNDFFGTLTKQFKEHMK